MATSSGNLHKVISLFHDLNEKEKLEHSSMPKFIMGVKGMNKTKKYHPPAKDEAEGKEESKEK